MNEEGLAHWGLSGQKKKMEDSHWEANRFKIAKKCTAFVGHEALP